MMIDKETAQTLATLMHHLRPEWDAPGCLASIAKVRHINASNVAMAAIRLCATPEAKTPGALSNLQGQHWKEKVAANYRHPSKRDTECPKHAGEWPDACRGCAADQLAGTPTPKRTTAQPAPDHYRAARLALKGRTE